MFCWFFSNFVILLFYIAAILWLLHVHNENFLSNLLKIKSISSLKFGLNCLDVNVTVIDLDDFLV